MGIAANCNGRSASTLRTKFWLGRFGFSIREEGLTVLSLLRVRLTAPMTICASLTTLALPVLPESADPLVLDLLGRLTAIENLMQMAHNWLA